MIFLRMLYLLVIGSLVLYVCKYEADCEENAEPMKLMMLTIK